MTIYENSRSMTSNVTSAEWAWRVLGNGTEPAWRLTWLPGPVTHEQARAAMELMEILSDPAAAQDAGQTYADQLAITVPQALALLHQRMHDRSHP